MFFSIAEWETKGLSATDGRISSPWREAWLTATEKMPWAHIGVLEYGLLWSRDP